VTAAWAGCIVVSRSAFRTDNHFFQVRLWDQDDLIDQLLAHYDKLDAGIRAELPLKRMWAVAVEAEDEE
jgi:predicted Mrr-cat superfamily restriction endonuclease